jgi:hypothetical protein
MKGAATTVDEVRRVPVRGRPKPTAGGKAVGPKGGVKKG